MNIVLISSGREKLFAQTIDSLWEKAATPRAHTLTIALDNPKDWIRLCTIGLSQDNSTVIVTLESKGASASRNIGASSIPKYRRQEHVCFLDDDVYMCPGWDNQLLETLRFGNASSLVVSGHAHPYNHPLGKYSRTEECVIEAAGVLSTVNIVMPWSIWDDVGFFVEPGGVGGSEDVEWCARAATKGYGLAVTSPQCVIHCGLISSNGNPIVGADLVKARNHELEIIHGIEGKVLYG